MRLLPLPGVFQPRSDSLMLARCLQQERLGPGVRVLDICTGSGLLAVTAAVAGASEVVAVDVSRRALFSAKLNARVNGVSVRAAHGDLFAPVRGEQFDVIVSNPPYLPAPAADLPRRGPERAWDAGPSGRVFIDRICDEVHEHLRPGGVLLMIQSSVCNIPQTLEMLAGHGLESSVAICVRGPLGPILQSRVDWLRDQGMLLDGDLEDVVVVKARQPAVPRQSRRDAEPPAERGAAVAA